MEILKADRTSLSKTFRGKEKQLLQGVSFSLNANECIALLGPSGSGKTSLLRLLNRLDEPGSGTITFNGKPLPEYPVPELRLAVNMTMQTPGLITGSVESDLNYGYCKKFGKTLSRDKLVAHFGRVGLPESVLTSKPQNLSGGEKQRIALLRSLLVQPQIFLLDEPTSALDIGIKETVTDTLRQFKKTANNGILVVTHDLEFAAAVADYGAILMGGSIRQFDTIDSVINGPYIDKIRQNQGENS